jgi:membrane protease YdiL (CAAX protease family)
VIASLVEEARSALEAELSRRNLVVVLNGTANAEQQLVPESENVTPNRGSDQQSLSTWRVRDAAAVGLTFTVASWGVLLFGIDSRLPLPSTYLTRYQNGQGWVLLGLVASLVAAGITVITIAKVRKLGEPLTSIGWNLNRRFCLVGILVGLSLTALITLLSALFSRPKSMFPDGLTPLSVSMFVLSSVLLGPFIEECYFRGILFMALARRVGELGSVALCALLFALFHIGGYRFLWIFVLIGVAMGILRQRTRSVAACYASHAAYNLGILIVALTHLG